MPTFLDDFICSVQCEETIPAWFQEEKPRRRSKKIVLRDLPEPEPGDPNDPFRDE